MFTPNNYSKAEVDELKRQVEEANADRDRQIGVASALFEVLALAERDAARYRWLQETGDRVIFIRGDDHSLQPWTEADIDAAMGICGRIEGLEREG